MTGRARRIAKLETMAQRGRITSCATATYAYGLAEISAGISLDDAIGAAIAEQGSHARRCVVLPAKMSREDWIELAQANQIKG